MATPRKRAHRKSGTRRLIVYYRAVLRMRHRYEFLPEIKLHGQWLRRSGFEVGQPINVAYRRNKLIITPARAEDDALATPGE